MAKLACKCGAVLRDDDPVNSGHLFRYGDYDIELDSSVLIARSYDVWGCPICGRLWIFWDHGVGVYPTEYVRYKPNADETSRLIQAKLDVILTRSLDPTVDWVDERGTTYVAIGNLAGRYFEQEWPHLQARLHDYLATADVVAVDVTGLAPRQRERVRAFVANLGLAVVVVGGSYR